MFDAAVMSDHQLPNLHALFVSLAPRRHLTSLAEKGESALKPAHGVVCQPEATALCQDIAILMQLSLSMCEKNLDAMILNTAIPRLVRLDALLNLAFLQRSLFDAINILTKGISDMFADSVDSQSLPLRDLPLCYAAVAYSVLELLQIHRRITARVDDQQQATSAVHDKIFLRTRLGETAAQCALYRQLGDSLVLWMLSHMPLRCSAAGQTVDEFVEGTIKANGAPLANASHRQRTTTSVLLALANMTLAMRHYRCNQFAKAKAYGRPTVVHIDGFFSHLCNVIKCARLVCTRERTFTPTDLPLYSQSVDPIIVVRMYCHGIAQQSQFVTDDALCFVDTRVHDRLVRELFLVAVLSIAGHCSTDESYHTDRAQSLLQTLKKTIASLRQKPLGVLSARARWSQHWKWLHDGVYKELESHSAAEQ